LATALRQVQRGGTVVAVGQLPQVEQGVEAWRIVTHELTITGSLRMHRELGSALDFLARPTSAVDPVISHVFPLDAALDAFAVAANTDASSKVLLRF
jgi:threonine dehydrogenase-like Zn-dependent dehydrogenase